jgi:hypothetical protein
MKDADGNVMKLGKRIMKTRKGKKKNYVYIYHKKDQPQLKIVGLPIIKNNATQLGPLILEEVIKPMILSTKRAKFAKSHINNILQQYLARPECLVMLAQEYKVKSASSYKMPNQIQKQISEGYFNGQGGVISLIKNNKCGKAGKTAKYCTVDEAIENKLCVSDLELGKVENELEPFVMWEK